MTDRRTSDHLLVHFIERSFDFMNPIEGQAWIRPHAVCCVYIYLFPNVHFPFPASTVCVVLWDLSVWLLLVSSCNNLLHILLKITHIKQIHSFILLPFKYSSVFSQTKHNTNVNPSKMTSQSSGTCLLQKNFCEKIIHSTKSKSVFFFFSKKCPSVSRGWVVSSSLILLFLGRSSGMSSVLHCLHTTVFVLTPPTYTEYYAPSQLGFGTSSKVWVFDQSVEMLPNELCVHHLTYQTSAQAASVWSFVL